MRKAFAFAGVDRDFTSEQFDREWEKSTAKETDRYQFMEKLIKLPGFRSFDRNFDRLPERMRWMVEKVVHDPEAPPAPKPELPDAILETITAAFTRGRRRAAGVRRPRVRRLEAVLSQCDEDRRRRRRAGGGRRAVIESSKSAATSRSPTARSPRASATTGPGPARRRPATSPRGAPSRRSSAAGPAPAPRSPPTRSTGSAPRSASTRRRRRARASGTTPTCSRSACVRPRRPSSARSSTPGSPASPARDADDRRTSSTSRRSRAVSPMPEETSVRRLLPDAAGRRSRSSSPRST